MLDMLVYVAASMAGAQPSGHTQAVVLLVAVCSCQPMQAQCLSLQYSTSTVQTITCDLQVWSSSQHLRQMLTAVLVEVDTLNLMRSKRGNSGINNADVEPCTAWSHKLR